MKATKDMPALLKTDEYLDACLSNSSRTTPIFCFPTSTVPALLLDSLELGAFEKRQALHCQLLTGSS